MWQRRQGFLIAVVAIVCSLFASLPALADSDVRIVRLSYLDGDAQVNATNQDDGFTRAVLNQPITAGMWLYTPNGGRAEVQFENGSTVRLVDEAQIQFATLSRADSGAMIDVINVDHGVIYFNFIKVTADDSITINAGGRTFHVVKSSHLRISADDKTVNVALFRGHLVMDGDQAVDIKGSQTVAFNLNTPDDYNVAQGVDDLGTDAWDKDRESEVASLSNRTSPYNYPTGYVDQFSYLGAYGNYSLVPGYGYVWQPYGMSAGWDPFMDGVWGFYPGYGYMWISAYPWGWAPYRYGQWNWIPGHGWVWVPGGNFNQWHVGPHYGAVPQGWHAPLTPTVRVGVAPVHVVVVGHPPHLNPEILAGRADAGIHPVGGPGHVDRLNDGEIRVNGTVRAIHPIPETGAGESQTRAVEESKETALPKAGQPSNAPTPPRNPQARNAAPRNQRPASARPAHSSSTPAHSGSAPASHATSSAPAHTSSGGGGRPK